MLRTAFVCFLVGIIALWVAPETKCPVPQRDPAKCAIVPKHPLDGQVSGIAAFEYSNSSRNGPLKWGELDCTTGNFSKFVGCPYCKNSNCKSTDQSPVDLVRSKAVHDSMSEAPVVELSRAAKVMFEATPSNFELICTRRRRCGSTVFGGKRYYLENVHMHHWSEHHLDGKQYPTEMHIVHELDGERFVLAIFFAEGVANSDLDQFLNTAKTKCYAKLNLQKLVAPVTEKHMLMHYEGTSTTPPCIEGVQWVVSQKPLTISKKQINMFNQMIAFGVDSRPIQFLDKRKLTLFDMK